jgi:hypothetical protein
MINSAIPEGTPFYTSGPSQNEVEKKMKKFRPYFSEIKELVDRVDKINITMYGKFPKLIEPGQGKLRTLEALELKPKNEIIALQLHDYSKAGNTHSRVERPETKFYKH